MCRKCLVLSVVIITCINAIASNPKPKKKKLNWQSLEQVNENFDSVRKPILIDIYTTWCHYCKLMDATTYRNDSVVAYLHKNFYRYKLNAETKESLTFRSKQYNYNQRYNLNDLAVYLSNGTIVFPTTVIITGDGQPFSQYGQLKAGELELLLKYFTEVDYKKITIQEFAKSFTPKWK